MTERDQIAEALDQSGIPYPEGADFTALLETFVRAFAVATRAVSGGYVRAEPAYQVMPSRSRLSDPTKTPEVDRLA